MYYDINDPNSAFTSNDYVGCWIAKKILVYEWFSIFYIYKKNKIKLFSVFYSSRVEGWLFEASFLYLLFEAFPMEFGSLEAEALMPQPYVSACAVGIVIVARYVSA